MYTDKLRDQKTNLVRMFIECVSIIMQCPFKNQIVYTYQINEMTKAVTCVLFIYKLVYALN